MARVVPVLLFVFAVAGSQPAVPSLVGSAGVGFSSPTLNVEWSIGEVVIGPFDPASVISSGIHQFEEPEPTPIVPSTALAAPTIRLHRSPGLLTVVFDPPGGGHEARLYGLRGELLRTRSSATGQGELSIPIPEQHPGVLVLRVRDRDGRQTRVFRVVGGH